MEWLNYHHLLYFWTVAREGGVARAAKRLRLSSPTISAQVRRLEQALGHDLFLRQGRALALSESGRVAFRYADEIFALGSELQDALAGGSAARPLRLVVGVSDVLPKTIVERLLQPAFALETPLRLTVREDRSVEEFLGELASHAIDLVLSDGPVGAVGVRAFSHLLGQCGTTFYASRALCRRYRRGFPRSLDGAPLLLPGLRTSLRRSLDQWFHGLGVRPRVVADVDDSALVEVLGASGRGIFAGPSAIERETLSRNEVVVLGRASSVTQQFYALSVERKLNHPAVLAISSSARKDPALGRRGPGAGALLKRS